MKNFILSLSIILFLNACSQEHSKPLNYPLLTNEGISSINEKTPYESRFILPKILGYEIDELSTFVNGKSLNIMRVHYKDNEAMVIIPTKADEYSKRYIKEIAITSKYVKNSLNLKINDSYNKDDFKNCKDIKKDIVCKKEGFENIKVVFSLDKNKKYALKEFIWSKVD